METSKTFSGAANKDADYTVKYMIDADGKMWKERIDTDGIISYELMS